MTGFTWESGVASPSRHRSASLSEGLHKYRKVVMKLERSKNPNAWLKLDAKLQEVECTSPHVAQCEASSLQTIYMFTDDV